MNKNNMICSYYLETMIPKTFTTQKVYFYRDGSKPYKLGKVNKYEWCESDLVYYHEDTDELFYMEIPENGCKTFSLKLGCSARLLVKF